MLIGRSYWVWRGISQPRARAVFRTASTAALLMTGSTPGKPRHTSHTFELGGSPSCPIAQPQNIFVRVRGCTWTSIPITTSQLESGNRSHLRLDAAGHLIRARDAQGDVLSPLRRQHLQTHREPLR